MLQWLQVCVQAPGNVSLCKAVKMSSCKQREQRYVLLDLHPSFIEQHMQVCTIRIVLVVTRLHHFAQGPMHQAAICRQKIDSTWQ